MVGPTPIKIDPANDSLPKCLRCDATMRLLGIESHPTVEQRSLLTYECTHCGELQTATIPTLRLNEAEGTVVPLHVVLADTAFDAETTSLLGTTFDAAWESLRASRSPRLNRLNSAPARKLLAKHILAMVQGGERNPERLIYNALAQIKTSDPDTANGASRD
jgi:hypothetical protein